MKIKYIAGIMAGILLISSLAGCGEVPEKKTAAMGRFMEEKVALPDGIQRIYGINQLTDGSILMMGEGEGSSRYLECSTDSGRTWKQQELPAELSEEQVNFIEQAEISPTGEIMIKALDEAGNQLFYLYGDGQMIPFVPKLDPIEEGGMVSASANGAASEDDGEEGNVFEDMGEIVELKNILREMKFGPEGQLLGQDLNGSVIELDKASGERLHTFEERENSYYFQIAGNTLVTVGENGFSLYDIAARKPLESQEALNEALGQKLTLDTVGGNGYGLICTSGEQEENLLYCNQQGLYSYIKGGSAVEQLINGDLNSMSTPEQEFQMLLCVDNQQYLLMTYDNNTGENHLYRYVYDETVPTVPDKELKVFALQDSGELRQAIAVYRTANPDVYVNLEAALSGEDGITAEDAIRTQNTSQLAGKGADVLILDGFPLESYLEKGMLTDISDLVEEVQNGDGIFENIRKAYEENGKIYVLPARFFLPVIQGEEETVRAGETSTVLGDYAEKMKKESDTGLFAVEEPREVLEELYHGESGRWMQEGSLSGEKVRAYLEAAKKIYDSRYFDEEGDDVSVSFASTGSSQSAITGTIASSSMNCAMGNGRGAYGLMGSVYDYMTMLAVEKAKEMTHGSLCGGKSFVPYLQAGISSKSQAKEEAREFLKVLWGKEANAGMLSGIPINRAALVQNEENVKNGDFTGGMALMNSDGTMSVLVMEAPSNEELQEFYELAGQADTPEQSSQVIKDLVLEEGEKYLSGSKDLETALKAIMQKAGLYLSE